MPFSMFSIWNVFSRREFNFLTSPLNAEAISQGRGFYILHKGERRFVEPRPYYWLTQAEGHNILPSDDLNDCHPNPLFVKSQSQPAPNPKPCGFYREVTKALEEANTPQELEAEQ